ncbi:MAG: hypothetical protein C0602_06490 [Denitrovibrio sp.]|nr:MAG: hypothetical protein C0602_06490 [Denitrovibrio sp.]
MTVNDLRPIHETSKHVWLIHSATTAIAATIALAVANLLNLGESYWAPISTIIVMQSTLGASWDTSKQRFAGTVIGALVAGIMYDLPVPIPVSLGIGIFIMGLICAGLKMVLSAFRFAGVTYAIIILLPHTETAWRIGLHRFIEVSLGIAVALVVTAIAPDHPFKKSRNK